MRLARSLRIALYATSAVVFLTGIAWLVRHFLLGNAAPARFDAIAMEIHGGAMMILLFLLGSAVALHVPPAWREAKNRPSGVLVSATMIVLAATGFLLYYAGDEQARSIGSMAHWTIGLAAPLFLALHVALAQRRRRSA